MRVALVGVGRWGEKHLGLLGERHDRGAGIELVAVVDTSASARERAAALRPGLRIAAELTEVLEPGVDALVIATPPETHAELARRALDAGKHLLVEKPLATNAVAARELAELAESRGLTLGTGHLVLHQPAYERLFACLRDAPATTMRSVREGVERGPIDPVEVLWSLGPHDVAVALRIFGPVLRLADTRPTERGVSVELASETGGRAEIRLERVPSPSRRSASVESARGRYELDEVAGTLHACAAGALAEPAPLELEAAAPPLDRQLDAFLRRIRGQLTGRPLPDPGPRVVALLEEAARRLGPSRPVNARPAAGTEHALPMAAALLPG